MKRIATFFVLFLILSLTLSFIAFAGPVPDTGQTQSYTDTFGEDSDYSINPQSYTKLDNQGNELEPTATSWAMVRDNVTGLIWEVKTDDGSIHDKDNKYNCQNAQDVFIKALNDNNFGGFSDWRMPTVKELTQIVNRGRYNPAINTDYFPNTQVSYYWSSTTDAYNPDNAWRVYFGYGYAVSSNKSRSYYVRAVRGKESGSFVNFIINGDGTVTDTSTGLMWQQVKDDPMRWEEALNYCESLTLAGYGDWRLPNINELQSIMDYSAYDPAIDVKAFPNTMASDYWSSTTSVSYPDYAWRVNFDIGYVGHYGKSGYCCVIAVCSGQVRVFCDLVISVIDAVSNDPIGDANVTVDTRQGNTDSSGSVTFEDIPFGVYDLEITAAGYIPIADSITISQAGITTLQYNLSPCELYFKDSDQDGYGLDNDSVCLGGPDPVNQYTTLAPGDCDDSDPNTYTGAPELCDGKDNNCDGYKDEDCPCEGDFDSDGDVDGSDLAVFAADFGRTDCPVSQTQSLKSENSLLKEEIDRLKAENAVLKKENEWTRLYGLCGSKSYSSR